VIELDVPVSVTAAPGLVLEAGDVAAIVPLDAVMRTVRVRPDAIVSSPEGDVLTDAGEALPYASLARVLGRTAEAFDPSATSTVVLLDARGARAAISVDRIVGVANDVVLPLPAPGLADPMVVGASVDATGNPRLALEPRVLVERVAGLRGAPKAEVTAEKKVILVVDDSLTSRMLERSILEAAGYEVVTASSGEEALELVRERPFALFVVDVEMPGMSGFDFVARTRADAALAGTPAVLVTSRSAPEDRRRGHEVGARAYIVKGELAQDQFLDSVRRLVG
jgi:two-component system chemotaxis sensor kinase CheA